MLVAMMLVILLAVLAVAALAAFVVALRASQRSGEPSSPTLAPSVADAGARPPGANRAIERLAIGAEVTYDGQAWFVRGTQRVTPTDGPAWTVWHLDDKGQSGWMATTDGDLEQLTIGVRAEQPETVDPHAAVVRWRNLDWRPLAPPAVIPATASGQRQGAAHDPIEEIAAGDVEYVAFGREALPRRRLICERTVGPDGRGPWNVWIGDRTPASMIDVPALGTVPPAA